VNPSSPSSRSIVPVRTVPTHRKYLEVVPAPKKNQRTKARPPQRRVEQRRAPRPRTAPTASRWALPAWPAWVWIWIAATAIIFLLRAGGAITSVPLCFFLSSVAGAFCFSFDQIREAGPAHPLLRFRQIVLVAVVVAMPSLFDPSTDDVDDLPRLVLLVVAAVLILAVWAVDATWNGWRPRRLLNGFQWIFGAIVIWFGVTTLTSVEPRQSFLGRQGTYEGLILIAALAILASALAETFKADALPALFRVVVAATVPALVYGAIQVYGFDVSKGSDIDFVQWSAAFHNVFASFGNPNHFGGFLVTVLPLGVVTAVLAKQRWLRAALWAWVALLLVLVLQTAARGAWLGGLVGGAILVVGLLPRLQAKARTTGLVAGVGLVLAVALIAGGSRFLGAKASALLKFGSGSSVSQRYGYWSAALHLAAHHPLVGTGPDTYAVSYAQYQSASLAKTLGNTFFVNGAHNIFLSWLANEGVPGFVLIVALFVVGIVWAARAWLSYRANASEPEAAEIPGPTQSEARRYLVAGLLAALVAYFVQASFDVEQVGTLFMLFAVLGLLGVVNRSVWPSASLVRLPFGSLRGASDGDAPRAEDDAHYPAHVAPVGTYGRSNARAQSDVRRLLATLIAGAIGVAAVGLTYWRADAMWRADHEARVGTQASVVKATQLNPWEPSYFQTLGEAAASAFEQNPKASDALPLIQDAVSYLREDVALDGSNSYAQEEYGDALASEADLVHSEPLIHMALSALRRSLQEDPFNTQLHRSIQEAEKPV
jgi:O-antigen ligase